MRPIAATTGLDWVEIVGVLAVLLATVRPLGGFMARVFQGQPCWGSALLRPVETVFYRIAGVQAEQEQGWLAYARSFLAVHFAGMVVLYALFRLQAVLPWNPAGQAGL